MQQHSFGYWLRLKRKSLDLTREGLADRVGYSAETVRRVETEERRPSPEMVERLAEIFEIPENERKAFLRFARGNMTSAPRGSSGLEWNVAAPRTNLPASLTSFIGREAEVAQIQEYLSKPEIRLVTLMGPPGIGKTRLSLESARASVPHFPDGVFFVALASLNDPNGIASAIMEALVYRESGDTAPEDQLRESIGHQQMLIVLDNCEHLVEAIAPIVSRLLSACHRLKILATSRESFRIPGEWLYSVPALDLPQQSDRIELTNASDFPALTLFAERARAVRPDFSLNANNIQAVAAICTQLDGLPLAIELIAARMRIMSAEALLERLNDHFTLHADGMRALSFRQKTLNHAIGWSFDLLSAEEQKLFAYLSVFSGGFTLEAAESTFSRVVTHKSVAELITSLLDKSLLQRIPHEMGETRFHMLTVIQQFARDRLRQMGAAVEAQDWHLTYLLDLAEQADREMRGPLQRQWSDRLEEELDNLRTALTWAMGKASPEPALTLAGALGSFWLTREHWLEGARWLDQALNKARDKNNRSEKAARARALYQRAALAHALDEVGVMRTSAESALMLCEEIKDSWGIAYSRVLLAAAQVILTGNSKASKTLLEQSLNEFHSLGDIWGESFVFIWLEEVQNELPENTVQIIARARLSGDRDLIARLLTGYATSFLLENEWEQAEKMAQEAEQLFAEIGPSSWTWARLLHVQILFGRRNLAEAKAEGQKLIEHCHRTGDKAIQAWSLHLLGLMAEIENDLQSAVDYEQKSLELLRAMAAPMYIALGINLARLKQRQGDDLSAKRHLQESIEFLTHDDVKLNWIGYALCHIGGFLAERKSNLAVQFLALFHVLSKTHPVRTWDAFNKPHFDHFLSTARAEFGQDEFAAAWETGAKMTMEEALHLVLKLQEELLD